MSRSCPWLASVQHQRRTMEKCSFDCRLVLACNNMSKAHSDRFLAPLWLACEPLEDSPSRAACHNKHWPTTSACARLVAHDGEVQHRLLPRACLQECVWGSSLPFFIKLVCSRLLSIRTAALTEPRELQRPAIRVETQSVTQDDDTDSYCAVSCRSSSPCAAGACAYAWQRQRRTPWCTC